MQLLDFLFFKIIVLSKHIDFQISLMACSPSKIS